MEDGTKSDQRLEDAVAASTIPTAAFQLSGRYCTAETLHARHRCARSQLAWHRNRGYPTKWWGHDAERRRGCSQRTTRLVAKTSLTNSARPSSSFISIGAAGNKMLARVCHNPYVGTGDLAPTSKVQKACELTPNICSSIPPARRDRPTLLTPLKPTWNASVYLKKASLSEVALGPVTVISSLIICIHFQKLP